MTELPRPIVHRMPWNSPTGKITLTITHTKTFFGRAHVIDIAIPPGTRFPLDTLSYLVTEAELDRAGSANAFIKNLIAAAENTRSWRKEATRAAQPDLFRPTPAPDPPVNSRSRRRRPPLLAPKR